MEIVNLFHSGDGCLETDITMVSREQGPVSRSASVPEEHLLEVYINEVLTMKLVCTPSNLTELVLGRLLTEGMIESAEDVEYLYLCEYGSRARVILRKQAQPSAEPFAESIPSCCTGNRVLNNLFSSGRQPQPLEPIDWKRDWIFAMAEAFSRGTPIHDATGGAHSCYLAVGGEILYCCEDLGRHNAMDKVIGMALRDGVNLHQAILFTSGRVPTDMAMKAIRAGVPVLVSKTTPTSLAVELARQYGLTLLCSAKKDSFSVYAGSSGR